MKWKILTVLSSTPQHVSFIWHRCREWTFLLQRGNEKRATTGDHLQPFSAASPHTNKILKALFNAANNKKCGVMAITMNLISFPFNCALPQPRTHKLRVLDDVKNLFIEPHCTFPSCKALARFLLKNRSNGNSHMGCRRFSVSH